MPSYDAIVVGAGPNGLAAAAALAQDGRSVLVVERAPTVGGGTRSEELTVPGAVHDTCSSVHPLGLASPFLRGLPLHEHGLEWVHPDLPLAHPLDPEQAVLVHRSIADTAAGLGDDGEAYARSLDHLVRSWPRLEGHVLGPVPRIPRHPVALGRFGVLAAPPASWTARVRFRGEPARALFAGCAAHAFLPLDRPLTSSFGWLLLTLAHRVGWPFARGGSQAIADALASYVESLGVEIETGREINDLGELPPARAVLLDLTPEGLVRLAGDRLPTSTRRRAARYRYGPAAFKLDYALAGPVPWLNPDLGRAGTIHLGGTFEDVAASEEAAWSGRAHPAPFLLVTQPSAVDPGRAPSGIHTLWVYGHVPNGSTVDFTDAIEARIEAFAPGFRDTVIARHVIGPPDWAARNPNYVGGDIAGGAHTLPQVVFRPVPGMHPYRTGIPGVYLCSSSTPPGAGVHGMCGYHAARAALAAELA